MNERIEYVKVNTSIQTGSNASETHKDEDGNIEATIELRLPDNLFSTPKQGYIDDLSMQTSKFRLSMENTPIAQIPLDMSLTTAKTPVSTCQLTVWPFCLLDDGQVKPVYSDTESLSLPFYNQQTVSVYCTLYMDPSKDPYRSLGTYRVDYKPNTNKVTSVSLSGVQQCFEKAGIFKKVNHCMNLIAQSNHEKLNIIDSSLFIKNSGTLEQMLQDALENAITYSSTTSDLQIQADFVYWQYAKELNLDPEATVTYSFMEFVFWEMSKRDTTSVTTNLQSACKPRVSLNAESLSISYDTVPFDEKHIPVLWNPSYVDTYETPEQMSLDEYRKSVWAQPPPKRFYRYNALIDDSLQDMSQYSLNAIPKQYNCSPMNIVGNKAMRDVFSFLPWVPCKLSDLPSSDYRPNLIFGENETTFYILDGTSTEVQVDQPELIKSETTLYTMSETTGERVTRTTAQTKHTNCCTKKSTPIEEARRTTTKRSGLDENLTPVPSVLAPLIYKVIKLTIPPLNQITSATRAIWEIGSWVTTESVPISSTTSTDELEEILSDSVETRTYETYYPNVYNDDETTTESEPSFISYDDSGFYFDMSVTYSYYDSSFTDPDPTLYELTGNLKPMSEAHENIIKHAISVMTLPQLLQLVIPYARGEGSTTTSMFDTTTKTTQNSDGTITYMWLTPGGGGKGGLETPQPAVWDYTVLTTVVENEPTITTETFNNAEITDSEGTEKYDGNVRLHFTWNNLPMVVLSPIASIVLTLQGMQVTQEIMPYNMMNPTGSSLTSSLPVIENYYSLAQTLRDLHDELVITKDTFDDTATYRVAKTSGMDRNIMLSAKYLTKEGKLIQIYIPPNGVFSLTLTFGLNIIS